MKKTSFFGLLLVLPVISWAQVNRSCAVKTLADLRAAVYTKEARKSAQVCFSVHPPTEGIKAASTPLSAVFLPRWSPNELPFFCKIEYDWDKKGRLPLKFRLGSVDYVDWLEGK